MRILVTGMNGFVGTHLASVLADKGHQVYGLDVRSEKTNVFECDITKKGDVVRIVAKIQPDVIFHLAGIARVDFEDPGILYNINVSGTLNLLSSLIPLNKRPKFIFISSSLVYGRISSSEIVKEDHLLRPVNHYGASKMCGEAMVMGFSKEYGFQSAIIRQFNQTGPGQTEDFVIAKIAAAFRRRDSSIELGNIDVYRDYLDVRDVVNAYSLLPEADFDFEIFNLASGNPVCIRDVISIFSNITSHKIEIVQNPRFIRQNEIVSIYGSSVKFALRTGWEKKFSFEQTLKDML